MHNVLYRNEDRQLVQQGKRSLNAHNKRVEGGGRGGIETLKLRNYEPRGPMMTKTASCDNWVGKVAKHTDSSFLSAMGKTLMGVNEVPFGDV